MADQWHDPDIRAALPVLARRHGDLPAATERLLRGLDERHQPDVPHGEDPTCTWCSEAYPCTDIRAGQALAVAVVEQDGGDR